MFDRNIPDTKIIDKLQGAKWSKCELSGWPHGINTFMYDGYVNEPIECSTTSYKNVDYFRYFKFGERYHVEKETYCGLSCGMKPNSRTISKIDINTIPIWGEEGAAYRKKDMEIKNREFFTNANFGSTKVGEMVFSPNVKTVITEDSIVLTGTVKLDCGSRFVNQIFYFFAHPSVHENDFDHITHGGCDHMFMFDYLKEYIKDKSKDGSDLEFVFFQQRKYAREHFIVKTVEYSDFIRSLRKDPHLIEKEEYSRFRRFAYPAMILISQNGLFLKYFDRDTLLSYSYTVRELIIYNALRRNGLALEYVHHDVLESLSDDHKKSSILCALRQNVLAFKYVDVKIILSLPEKSIENIMLAAVENGVFSIAPGEDRLSLKHIWDQFIPHLSSEIKEKIILASLDQKNVDVEYVKSIGFREIKTSPGDDDIDDDDLSTTEEEDF